MTSCPCHPCDLLGDPHLAEDAVQDAMQAAIERPPRARDSLPAWLRTVVRRCALDLRRGERRRRTRERAVARVELSGPSDTHEQVEVMQRLLAAVQSLPEPYRSTVWQRYYKDRSPAEIAALRHEPLKTVKTRLGRALAQLRSRLDQGFGDRRTWMVLMAPLTHPANATAIGAVLMSAKAKLALVGVVGVGLALSVALQTDEPGVPTQQPVAIGALAVPRSPNDAPTTTARRTAAATDAAASPAVAPDALFEVAGIVAPARPLLGGLVLDLDGQPVAGVAITGNGTRLDPEVLTGPEGRFAGVRERSMTVVGIDDERYVPVLEPHLYGAAQTHEDLTIVVARRTRLAGTVVDTAGLPIASAQIAVSLGVDLRTRIPRVLDRCADAKFEAMTPDDGAFTLDAVPLAPSARVHIIARGYRGLDLAVADARHQTRFVLERTVTGDTLEGVVVDENDRPLSQAVVMLHDYSVVIERNGRFKLDLWKVGDLPAGTLPELSAAASNRLPGKLACLLPDWRSRGAWPSTIRLRLRGATESIRGRVQRHDGTPIAGAQVSFVPPEPEQIRPTMFDSRRFGVVDPPESADDVDPTVGAFVTPRVVPGRYRLRVFDPHSLDVMLTDPIRTGQADVVLRFPDRGHWPALRGRVVDRRGDPVGGADWIVERDDPLPGATAPLNGGWHNATADGRIEHQPLSRDVHTLCVKAAGMANWLRFKLADLPRLDDFQVVVPLGCNARIEVGATWGRVDKAALVDVAGERSSVVVTHGNVAWGTRDIGISDGRSQTFVALDDCVELLLFRSDEIVGRVPITLSLGVMNVLRP